MVVRATIYHLFPFPRAVFSRPLGSPWRAGRAEPIPIRSRPPAFHADHGVSRRNAQLAAHVPVLLLWPSGSNLKTWASRAPQAPFYRQLGARPSGSRLQRAIPIFFGRLQYLFSFFRRFPPLCVRSLDRSGPRATRISCARENFFFPAGRRPRTLLPLRSPAY